MQYEDFVPIERYHWFPKQAEVIKWSHDKLKSMKIMKIEHAKESVNDRLYFDFNVGRTPAKGRYVCERITLQYMKELGTYTNDNYSKSEYDCKDYTISQIDPYLNDGEIMCLEIYDQDGKK